MSGHTFPPVLEDDAARIVIEIHNSDPLDLHDFTASLTGLAREHEATFRRLRPDLDSEESRLLVMDVRKGSIVIELAATLAPFVAPIELTNTAVSFVKNMKAAIGILALPGGRLSPEEATTQRLKNFGDAVAAVANDTSGHLDIRAKLKDGEALEEFRITKIEAVNVVANAAAQRREIEQPGSATHRKVLLRLHQSSLDELKTGKKTAEKGVVERVDDKPRPLVYVSDLAGQQIKSAIVAGSPWTKGFIVDLDVETVGGRPKVYRVLEVHEIIDLEEE